MGINNICWNAKLFNLACSAYLAQYTHSSLVGRFKVRVLAICMSTFSIFSFSFFFPFNLHSSLKDTLDMLRIIHTWKNVWRLTFYIYIDNNVEMQSLTQPHQKFFIWLRRGFKDVKLPTNTLVIKRAKLQFFSTGFWIKVAFIRLF